MQNNTAEKSNPPAGEQPNLSAGISVDVPAYMRQLGHSARRAAAVIATAASLDKNAALEAIAHSLLDNEAEILKANSADLQAGKRNNLSKRVTRPACAQRRTGCRHRRRLPPGRPPARPGRGNHRPGIPPKRHSGRQNARAAGGYRDRV